MGLTNWCHTCWYSCIVFNTMLSILIDISRVLSLKSWREQGAMQLCHAGVSIVLYLYRGIHWAPAKPSPPECMAYASRQLPEDHAPNTIRQPGIRSSEGPNRLLKMLFTVQSYSTVSQQRDVNSSCTDAASQHPVNFTPCLQMGHMPAAQSTEIWPHCCSRGTRPSCTPQGGRTQPQQKAQQQQGPCCLATHLRTVTKLLLLLLLLLAYKQKCAWPRAALQQSYRLKIRQQSRHKTHPLGGAGAIRLGGSTGGLLHLQASGAHCLQERIPRGTDIASAVSPLHDCRHARRQPGSRAAARIRPASRSLDR